MNQNPSFGGHPSITGPGFGSPIGNANDINFSTGTGNTLTYTQWHWTYDIFDFNSNPVVVNGTGGNYTVVAVYDADDTPTAGEVVPVLSDMGNNMYFVAIPLFNVLNNTVASPLFGNYPSTTLTNFSNSSIGFAVVLPGRLRRQFKLAGSLLGEAPVQPARQPLPGQQQRK